MTCKLTCIGVLGDFNDCVKRVGHTKKFLGVALHALKWSRYLPLDNRTHAQMRQGRDVLGEVSAPFIFLNLTTKVGDLVCKGDLLVQALAAPQEDPRLCCKIKRVILGGMSVVGEGCKVISWLDEDEAKNLSQVSSVISLITTSAKLLKPCDDLGKPEFSAFVLNERSGLFAHKELYGWLKSAKHLTKVVLAVLLGINLAAPPIFFLSLSTTALVLSLVCIFFSEGRRSQNELNYIGAL
jgi:hypothetical protein